MLEVRQLQYQQPPFFAHYNCSAPAGQLTALIGESGCGKSTLLQLIAGLLTPHSGSVHFAGRNLGPLPAAKRPVSLLFQEHNLFPHLSVQDNIAIGLSPRRKLSAELRERVDEALQFAGLSPLRQRLPGALSGGQRQRVALARAMARRSPLLLLDEPFNGLDPGRRRRYSALLDAMRQHYGTTILMSTHNPEEIRDSAAHMVFIHQGAVRIEGAASALMRRTDCPALLRYLGRDSS